MIAVAGPSKRFCSHCYRAIWACEWRAVASSRLKSHNALQRSGPWNTVPRYTLTTLPRTFATTSTLNAAKKVAVSVPMVNMEEFPPERIRNFSIIAHIDHGKSTLADRLLQMTNTLPADSSPQFLDRLKVERERGITVKAQTVSIIHTHTDGNKYLINLIDTPGHVDFAYEVSRSLGACEGGLLLVDSTQGIQAQTLSVYYVALEADLTILGVINKIDLPHADAETVSETMESQLGIEKAGYMRISAKSGIGVDEVLRQIIEVLPPPRKRENDDGKLRALVFDTHYDHFRGVVSLIRVVSGSVKIGDKIRFLQADRKYEVTDIGINNPDETPVTVLQEGQVGYLVCSMKNSEEAHIGDTICHDSALVDPLPGFKPSKSMVFAGVFPTDSADFDKLEEAIGRLTLNDRSVTVARESSAALMQGFRLGFLGTLHMDVFKQRLEDEYSSEVIITSPTVPYRVTKGGVTKTISNPCDFPEHTHGYIVEEPMIHSTIIVPTDYLGPLMDLCSKYRSRQLEYRILETNRAILRYAFPLAEIVTDFFSALKSTSSGYASFDYEEAGYEESDLGKLNILLNGNAVDALSMIVHKSAAQSIGKQWCQKMKDVIPRQQFELAVQAAFGGKIIARETVKAVRKDVTAGLYGGHYERKKKHLEKQKAGKKRLKRLAGNIDVPQSAFFSILSRSYATMTSRNAPTDIATISDHSSPRKITFRYPVPEEAVATSTKPLIVFPTWLPKYHLPQISDAPLSAPAVSPYLRSGQLSRLNGLLDPTSRPGAKQLHDAFSDVLRLSKSPILTPGEISAVLDKLLQSIRREGTEHYQAQQMIEYAQKALDQFEKRPDSVRILSLRLESTSRPSARALKQVEKRLMAFPENQSDMEYRNLLHLYLRLCAARPDEERFERWWTRAQSIGLDLHFHATRLSLLESLGTVDQIEGRFAVAMQYIADGKEKRKDLQRAYLNHALGVTARAGNWDFTSRLYEAMSGFPIFSTETSGLFVDSSGGEEPVSVSSFSHVRDLEIHPDRITYSTLVKALARTGYLAPTTQILSDMETANHSPFVREYAALFQGFKRYSEVVPPESEEQNATYTLFPDWKIYQMGNLRPPTPWSGSYEFSEWTRSALDQAYAKLLALRPGTRRVENPLNEDQRVDPYRAPSPQAILDLLFAYARVSGCNAGLLVSIWEAVDAKFSAGEWTDWMSIKKEQLEEMDDIDEPQRAELEPVVDRNNGQRRGDWNHWRANSRLVRLVLGLQAVQRGEPLESLMVRERKSRSRVSAGHLIAKRDTGSRGPELRVNGEVQSSFGHGADSFFTSHQ